MMAPDDETPDCTCIAAWAKRPDVKTAVGEHHPDCRQASAATPEPTAVDGAFVEIDEKKLGREGLKLLGGINALMGAIGGIEKLRAGSDNVQERVFLAEIAKFLMQGVERHQDELAAHAVKRGAGKLHEIPKDAKAN